MNINKWLILDTKRFIAYNKPPGVLCQGTKDEEISMATRIQQVHKKKTHLLNRLDRPVGGLVLFSKDAGFTKMFQAAQLDNRVRKSYYAIVEGKVSEAEGEYENNIIHDKRHFKARIINETDKGKKVTLSFERIKTLDNYTVLKISLHSGKFHQIRAQLAYYGHPIKGDVKYGARRKNKDRSIYLYATDIQIEEPNGEMINIKAELPEDSLWELAKN